MIMINAGRMLQCKGNVENQENVPAVRFSVYYCEREITTFATHKGDGDPPT